MNQALVLLAEQEAPKFIQFLKDEFGRKNPDEPVPTSDQVVAAWKQGLTASLAKDDSWDANHPATSDVAKTTGD